jgi:LacI family transcriptional regulator
MATIYEVSRLAGVSLATVSRVMNNSGKVTSKTRQKVEAVMKDLDYRPNAMAQSLASNRSNSVGVLVPMFYGPCYGEMLAGIEEELRAEGKHVVITAGHSEAMEEKSGIEFLLTRRCDALIIHADEVSDYYLIELSKGEVPIILINRLIPEMADNCIVLNNEQGGYLATRAVLDLGHRELAYISGPQWKADANERLAGHKRALAEYGLPFDERLVVEGNYQESGGIRGMQQLLQLGLPFSVVICANDETAAGASGVAREQGLAIPDDISVMGFDNVSFTRYLRPKLATVNHPVNEMGRMAARCALKAAYKLKHLEIQNLFEPNLVMRNSVGRHTASEEIN